MTDTPFTIRAIDDVAPYAGPHQIPGIRFRPARAALGVRAWGMNVLELDPHCERYPEHDHVADGQEEVYVVLSGSAVLVVDGREEGVVKVGDMVRVAPAQRRKFVTREQGVQLLALGATPGAAFTPTL